MSPVSWQPSTSPLPWLQLNTSVVLDLPVTLSENNLETGEESLLKQIDMALAPFIQNLERAVCVFDNQILEGNSRLVPQVEKEYQKC